MPFGAWTYNLRTGREYDAPTDGLVVATVTATVGQQGRVVGSTRRQRTQWREQCAASAYTSAPNTWNVPGSSFTMPVRAGDIWKVDAAREDPGTEPTFKVQWISVLPAGFEGTPPRPKLVPPQKPAPNTAGNRKRR